MNPGADGEANGHGEDHECRVTRILDDAPEANDRQGPDEAEGPRRAVTDRQGDHGDHHRQKEERLREVGGRGGVAAPRRCIDDRHEASEDEPRRGDG